jgi:succinate dehydrogenase / fumarate reductase iron-sulfur subunit
MSDTRIFEVYRYDPEVDAAPRMQSYEVELDGSERMLLDALMKLKKMDETLSFRRSCREGVCGSDAMNINGKNGLACLTNMLTLPKKISLRPLPGLPVVRDLIVDMTQFFKQYHSIRPYLVNDTPPPEKERLQSPEEREELDGLYECILCASCSTACPSFWWNPDKFVGPAGLLQAYRFIADSRDQVTSERLDNLEDPYRLFRCHTIMNCVDVCPKGLNPTKALITPSATITLPPDCFIASSLSNKQSRKRVSIRDASNRYSLIGFLLCLCYCFRLVGVLTQ